MKSLRCFILTLFTFFLLAETTLAQDTTMQNTDLPELTVEQRWKRAAWTVDLAQVAAIGHAKSLGKTAEDYARFGAKLYAPGWGAITSPWGMIRAMCRNFQMWPGFEIEVVKRSEDAVTARFKRAYMTTFGEEGVLHGVTLSEYDLVWKVFHQIVAEHLGFDYEHQFEGDHFVVSISRKMTEKN